MPWLVSFKTAVFSTLQIFLMGGVGFFLLKRKVITEEGLNFLSKLLINFFFPLFTFYQITQHFTFSLYPQWWIFPLMSFAITAGGFIVSSLVLLMVKDIEPRKEFKALVGFQNSGFLPLVLAAAMLPATQAQELYVRIFLFLIGFDLIFWSLGVHFMTGRPIKDVGWRALVTPPIISIATALFLVIFQVTRFLPEPLIKGTQMFGDCALPVAMLVVGGNLALIKITDLRLREISLAVLSKLILLPALGLLFIFWTRTDFLTGLLIMIQTSVPSATSLSVISRHYRLEEKLINHGIFFSHLVSLATIPVFLAAYVRMAGTFPF